MKFFVLLIFCENEKDLLKAKGFRFINVDKCEMRVLLLFILSAKPEMSVRRNRSCQVVDMLCEVVFISGFSFLKRHFH